MFELIPFGRNVRPVSYDPFRMFDEMERSFFTPERPLKGFRTDVIDAGSAYRLEAELPGFRKENISLDVENDCLTISAERSVEENESKESFIKRERFYGSYSRSFDVSGIDQENIEAAYNDGILTLTLPKKAAERPASRRLEIK